MSKCSDQLNTSLKNGSSQASNGDNLIPPSIQAYKSDNAKLIKENNELHLELIKIKDDFELEIKDLKSKLHKVDHENSDLRFLNTQYLHKLRAVEKESKDKSKKILELQEKNFQAVIQTPGLKRKFPEKKNNNNTFLHSKFFVFNKVEISKRYRFAVNASTLIVCCRNLHRIR